MRSFRGFRGFLETRVRTGTEGNGRVIVVQSVLGGADKTFHNTDAVRRGDWREAI
jgi:hypothetical protein